MVLKIPPSTVDLLMDVLKEPKTFKQVSEITGIGVPTCRRRLKELHAANMIVLLPYSTGRGREQVFQVRGATYVSDKLYLYFKRFNRTTNRRMTVGQMVNDLVSGKEIPLLAAMQSSIIHLLVRSVYKHEGLQTPAPLPSDTKIFLRKIKRQLEAWVNIIDQVLYLPIWDDNPKLLTAFGFKEEDLDKLRGIAATFEEKYTTNEWSVYLEHAPDQPNNDV